MGCHKRDNPPEVLANYDTLQMETKSRNLLRSETSALTALLLMKTPPLWEREREMIGRRHYCFLAHYSINYDAGEHAFRCEIAFWEAIRFFPDAQLSFRPLSWLVSRKLRGLRAELMGSPSLSRRLQIYAITTWADRSSRLLPARPFVSGSAIISVLFTCCP
jgi:hypothetical protein